MWTEKLQISYNLVVVFSRSEFLLSSSTDLPDLTSSTTPPRQFHVFIVDATLVNNPEARLPNGALLPDVDLFF